MGVSKCLPSQSIDNEIFEKFLEAPQPTVPPGFSYSFHHMKESCNFVANNRTEHGNTKKNHQSRNFLAAF